MKLSSKLVCAGIAMVACALGAAVQANDVTFEITPVSYSATSVHFTGKAVAADALNKVMTPEVCYESPTSAFYLYRGDTHTFTSIDEQHVFEVTIDPDIVPNGALIGIALNDNPGSVLCGFDKVGAFQRFTFRYAIPVPTMNNISGLVLILALALLGLSATRRRMAS